LPPRCQHFETQSDAAARNRDIDDRNRIGIALVGGAVVAGVTSAILFWRASRADEPGRWAITAGPASIEIARAF